MTRHRPGQEGMTHRGNQRRSTMTENPGRGVPAQELSDADLLRELEQVHTTRHETLRHGSADALTAHTQRLGELEDEYLRRFPDREVDPERLRSGARARSGQPT
jgi:uncharacterized protein DUF6158